MNGGWALGLLSEEALESNNKFVRRYLEQNARTCSPILQLTDAMTRLIERSDPGILQLVTCEMNLDVNHVDCVIKQRTMKNIRTNIHKLHSMNMTRLY